MIVVCNKCDTRYKLDRDQILEEGSDVRCSQCEYVWLQKPEISKVGMQQFADSFVSALGKNRPISDNKFVLGQKELFLILLLLSLFAFQDYIEGWLNFLLS